MLKKDLPEIHQTTGGARCGCKASLGPTGHIAEATSFVRRDVAIAKQMFKTIKRAG